VTTCFAGRNRKVAEAFSRLRGEKSIEVLEREILNGQKLQGPETAKELNCLLKAKGLEKQFPLFTAVHNICTGQQSVLTFIDELRNHPEHL
jgi:glycerol-3-phosphate dehydrogenase (NAD+)